MWKKQTTPDVLGGRKLLETTGAVAVRSRLLVLWLLTATAGMAAENDRRTTIWVDVYRGEPVQYEDVLDDLAGVRVVYLGECHALERHHEIQLSILRDLAARDLPLALGLEQLEHFQQPHLDRYNEASTDYEELAKATKWAERWKDFEQYRAIVETARELRVPIIALNARAETIRQVARSGGVDGLDAKAREELPKDLQLEDPTYEKLLNLELMVHMSATPDRLRPIREAQIARDEMMASVLCAFLGSETRRDRTAIVLCGAGHVSYGLGMVSRVRRRMPGVKDRVIVLTQSGDLELSPEEQAMARDIEITHEQLRAIDRPVADYLHVKSLARRQAPE